MFEIWRGDSPAPFQVTIEAITEYVPERPIGFVSLRELHTRLLGIQFEWQGEGFENVLCQFVVGNSVGTRRFYCFVEGRS